MWKIYTAVHLPSVCLVCSYCAPAKCSGHTHLPCTLVLVVFTLLAAPRPVSGKYMLGFFWNLSFRIIPKDDRLFSLRFT